MNDTVVKVMYKDAPQEQTDRLMKFRATHRFTQANIKGVTWNYLVCGRGEKTLVLLPGDERRGDAAFPLIQAWEQEYRIIYPSYPAVSTIGQLVEGLAALLEKEQIEACYLLGASFGGNIAQCFVRRYPRKVEKLILQNTTVPQPETIKSVALLKKMLSLMPKGMVRRLLNQMMLASISAPQEELLFWQAYMREFTSHQLTKKDALALFEGIIDYRRNYCFTPDDLVEWPGKILLIESEDDRPITPSMRTALKATYPQAQICTFKQGGHTPFLLHTEKYFSTIRSFLNEIG